MFLLMFVYMAYMRGGMHMWQEECMVGCVRAWLGACVRGVYAWCGVCVPGGACAKNASGWYASYWNALSLENVYTQRYF